MRKRKIWQLQKCDREYAAGIAADLGVSPVVVSVLLNRGVREKEEIREFLFGSEQPFHEPLLMKDMQKAAERILEAVKNGEQIIAVFVFAGAWRQGQHVYPQKKK